jgi:hypothetical protein
MASTQRQSGGSECRGRPSSKRFGTRRHRVPDREREGSQVTYDWVTLVHGKIDALKPAMAPMIGK